MAAPLRVFSLRAGTKQTRGRQGTPECLRQVSAVGLPEGPLVWGGGWGLLGSGSPEGCKSGAIEKACGQQGEAPQPQRRRQPRGDAHREGLRAAGWGPGRWRTEAEGGEVGREAPVAATLCTNSSPEPRPLHTDAQWTLPAARLPHAQWAPWLMSS